MAHRSAPLFLLLLTPWVQAQPATTRPVLLRTPVARWVFDQDAQGWSADHACTLRCADGALQVAMTGADPYLHGPAVQADGPCELTLRVRFAGSGAGQVYWTTAAGPQFSEARVVSVPLPADGAWHEVVVALPVVGTLTRLRFDPGQDAGSCAVAWIALARVELHPLAITGCASSAESVRLTVRNDDVRERSVACGATQVQIAAGGTAELVVAAPCQRAFDVLDLQVQSAGLPDLRQRVCRFDARQPVQWLAASAGDVRLEVAADGSGGRVLRRGFVQALLHPLVARDGAPVPVAVRALPDGVALAGERVTLELRVHHDGVALQVASPDLVEAPVVRVPGTLEQAVFPGLEYLGRREASSSELDIEGPGHERSVPALWKVTGPYLACVTTQAGVVLWWDDAAAQPAFSAPNRWDGTDDHRLSLRSRTLRAQLRVGRAPVTELVATAVTALGLPPVPEPPRARAAQQALTRAGIAACAAPDGRAFGHCAEASWPRHPYADHASTLLRLDGAAPPLPQLVSGGAHLRNDAAWLVTGRAAEWLALRRAEVQGLLAAQQLDGSFRYRGPFRKGHFEDTASGYCADKATLLLERARLTGDPEALAGGVRALEFLQRFRTPRGAQTWELSLHTPDILAAAYLTWCHVLGYELTGEARWLAAARSWALSGIPFVYLRGPASYATIAVFGATQWHAPDWMGLPVQWCGVVYAYALQLLAAHDHTLDWAQLARGILVRGELMQCPDGPFVGCLPDSWTLPDGRRQGPMINPCALWSLRTVVEGGLDGLAVAQVDGHRVVAPFPIAVRDGEAWVACGGTRQFQVVVDGARVVTAQANAERWRVAWP